jgi:hypothetical protein
VQNNATPEKSHKDLIISFFTAFDAFRLPKTERSYKPSCCVSYVHHNIKIRDKKMKELSPSKQILLCVSLLLINIIFNVVIPNPNPW